MKHIFLICAFLLSMSLVAQTKTNYTYTYSPDSTSLSIIFENPELNSKASKFSFDLKDKWVHKKTDSINVFIRVQLIGPNLQNKDSLKICFGVFGKWSEKIIHSENPSALLFLTSRKQYLKNSSIKIVFPKRKGKKSKLFVDSIDVSTKTPQTK